MQAGTSSRVTPLREPPSEPSIPPVNTEAEQALIGAIFINPIAYGRVSGFLLPEHFANAVHGRIYAAIGKLIDRGVTANPVTLKNLFDQDGALAEIGGAQYLARLAESAVTIINAEHYGRAIHDLHLRRELINIGQDIVSAGYLHDLDDPATKQIERAEAALMALTVGAATTVAGHASDASLRALHATQAAYQTPGKLAGLTTGLDGLDQRLGGLAIGNLIVAGGATGQGKTNLGCALALNASEAGIPSIIFSGEMPAEEIGQRLLARLSGVSAHNQRRGAVEPSEWPTLVKAQQQLTMLPLHIDDAPLTLGHIRSMIRDLRHRRHAIQLVVIDYLQLIRLNDQGRHTRFDEVSAAAAGLKALAKQLGVAVVALAQLGRGVDQREDKRPILSDLRMSGDIENFADIVMLIFRQEPYLARAEPVQRANENSLDFDRRHSEWSLALSASRGRAEIIIPKNRHGPTGSVRVGFDAARSTFTNEQHYGERYGGGQGSDLFTG